MKPIFVTLLTILSLFSSAAFSSEIQLGNKTVTEEHFFSFFDIDNITFGETVGTVCRELTPDSKAVVDQIESRSDKSRIAMSISKPTLTAPNINYTQFSGHISVSSLIDNYFGNKFENIQTTHPEAYKLYSEYPHKIDFIAAIVAADILMKHCRSKQ